MKLKATVGAVLEPPTFYETTNEPANEAASGAANGATNEAANQAANEAANAATNETNNNKVPNEAPNTLVSEKLHAAVETALQDWQGIFASVKEVIEEEQEEAQPVQGSESKVREVTKQLEQGLDKAEERRLAAGNRIAEVEAELEKLKTTRPDEIASKPDHGTRTADAVQDPAVDWEAFYGGLGGLFLQRLEGAVDWEAFYGSLGGIYLRRLDGPLLDYPSPSKKDVLVFSDAYGICTEIGELVPPGCVGIWDVQRLAADKYTEKGVKHLVGMRPWDLIIFALGVDPPRSRHGVCFRKHQADVVKAFGRVLRAIRGDAGRGKRLAVLTVECFDEESDFHKDNCFCDSPLFWQCYGETGVLCPIKFIDTEWQRSPENLEHIRDELFRLEPFGLDVVRILTKGCFRLRHRGPSEAGLEEGSEPESEYEETGSEEESEEEESEEEEERGPEADLAFAAEQWAKERECEGGMEFEALHD